MERAELRLIRDDRGASSDTRPRARPALACAFAIALAGLAGAATYLGADAAREPIEARERAAEATAAALEHGNTAPEVRAALLELRTAISRRPLDSKTRIAYASLLLGMSRRLEDAAVAAFHAGRAAALAPATLSVVRPAVLIQVYAGRIDEAIRLVRSIFSFEPRRAADSLVEIEPHLASISDALPNQPDAWLAWSSALEERGRTEEAHTWLERTRERWPDYLPAVQRSIERAAEAGDWERVAELLPPEPWGPGAQPSRLLLRRARVHAEHQEAAAAHRDVERALAAELSAATLFLAGEVAEVLGEPDQARDHWNRGLFMLGRESPHVQGWFLERLARLEEREGHPAAALRHWRALLEIHPAHAVARRHADDLSGFSRP